MDTQKDKLFIYCLIVLLPILIVAFGLWLIGHHTTMPQDEWMQTFIEFVFGCLMCMIFIWHAFRRDKRFPKLSAAIVGILSMAMIVWLALEFHSMSLDHWFRVLGLAVCLLLILSATLWSDIKR
jgi:hypothetical protein